MPRDRVNSAAAVVITALLLICGPGAGNAAGADLPQSTEYLTGADDLPLIPGLNEIPSGSLVFDKPGGRIVEAQASGAMTWQQVAAFYSSALPQLGWVIKTPQDGGLRFERDGEILAIQRGGDDAGDVLINFRIAPRPAPRADTEK